MCIMVFLIFFLVQERVKDRSMRSKESIRFSSSSQNFQVGRIKSVVVKINH